MKKMYFFLVALLCVLINPTLNAQSADALKAALISSSDVDVTIVNDATYPWVPSADTTYITNGNLGHAKTSSTISISYSSERSTEIKVDYTCHYNQNWSSSYPHNLYLYIDGVLQQTAPSGSNNSYVTPRYYLPAGEHVITFRDSIGNNTSTDYYSRIKNLRIREIIPLETVDSIAQNSDVKLTVLYNDPLYPWLYDAANGCLTNDNLGFAKTSSTITMSYASDKVTEFKVDWLCHYNQNYNSSPHNLYLYIDGVLQQTAPSGSNTSYVTPRYYLPAGEHLITFRDSIGNSTSTDYYSRIKNLRIREIHPAEVVDFVSYSDVDITLSHDTLYPWVRMSDGIITNDNLGFAKTSSTIMMSYTSDKITEFKVDWLCHYNQNYNSSPHN